ncbi:restriction endonuclease subunit S [Blastococcus litoris]|uniref:restriction endonuclease subunit S n=1 Tax=Blastococcus litoris TaxID=2171622 RepID=UPI000E30265B|nr:restriction endonuclease subunit S [Blastococcus litoris]
MSPALRSGADVLLGRMRSPENAAGEHMTPYLRAANVGDGELILDDIKTMNFSPSEQLRYALEPGDVLVTEGSGSRSTVGASAAWVGSPSPMMFQNTLLRLRARPHVEPRFLYWWSRHAFVSGLYAEASQGLAIWHLGGERVRALSFDPPERTEQRRIADFLNDQVNRLDRAIALGHRQLELTDQASISEMTSALIGEEEVRVPIRWLGARVTTGPFGTVLAASEYVDGGVPIINPSHIRDGRLHPSHTETIPRHVADRLRRHRLGSGDLVVSRKGDIGRSALVNDQADGWICGSDSIAIQLGHARIRPRFLQALLRLPVSREQLLQRSIGATMPSLNEGNLLGLRIPDVSQDEQEAREKAASRLDKENMRLRGLLTAREAVLQERKQALITAAVTGQFDVTTARGVA